MPNVPRAISYTLSGAYRRVVEDGGRVKLREAVLLQVGVLFIMTYSYQCKFFSWMFLSK